MITNQSLDDMLDVLKFYGTVNCIKVNRATRKRLSGDSRVDINYTIKDSDIPVEIADVEDDVVILGIKI